VSDNVPPSSPPLGPPPSGPPPGAEYLEQGRGEPVPSGPRGSARKRVLIGGGSLLGIAVLAGGAFGAYWFLSSGPQPAEALPDSTLAYVSIDLDPSGAQKIEALRTLKKFPAFKDELDFDTTDDVRQRLFEQFQEGLDCPDLDYADDIEPWLGDRAALAAVDIGEDTPAPVFVLQVKDADQAETGLTAIKDCATATSGDDAGGWAINGDWAIVAETNDIAATVADDADQASLADDATYQKWTDAAGDRGIVTMYAAPAAGQFLADAVGTLGDPFGILGGSSGCAVASSSSDGGDVYEDTCSPIDPSRLLGSGLPPLGALTERLADFKGAAATVRFDNGALELELAGDSGISQTSAFAGARAADVLATLPDDTAAAVGAGFADGWFDAVLEQVSAIAPDGSTVDDLIAQLESDTGLDLPADAETLAGEAAALSIGSDLDPEVFFNSSDGSGVPVAVKVKGDATAIKDVLAKIRATMSDADAAFLDADSDGDLVAIGPDADYRAQVLANGDLGSSDVFKDVVREADRADAIVYVNFDAGDWLLNLVAGDEVAADNLEPLSGAGLSTWTDGDVTHAVLRVTTN
jgi:hypothetical protein